MSNTLDKAPFRNRPPKDYLQINYNNSVTSTLNSKPLTVNDEDRPNLPLTKPVPYLIEQGNGNATNFGFDGEQLQNPVRLNTSTRHILLNNSYLDAENNELYQERDRNTLQLGIKTQAPDLPLSKHSPYWLNELEAHELGNITSSGFDTEQIDAKKEHEGDFSNRRYESYKHSESTPSIPAHFNARSSLYQQQSALHKSLEQIAPSKPKDLLFSSKNSQQSNYHVATLNQSTLLKSNRLSNSENAATAERASFNKLPFPIVESIDDNGAHDTSLSFGVEQDRVRGIYDDHITNLRTQSFPNVRHSRSLSERSFSLPLSFSSDSSGAKQKTTAGVVVEPSNQVSTSSFKSVALNSQDKKRSSRTFTSVSLNPIAETTLDDEVMSPSPAMLAAFREWVSKSDQQDGAALKDSAIPTAPSQLAPESSSQTLPRYRTFFRDAIKSELAKLDASGNISLKITPSTVHSELFTEHKGAPEKEIIVQKSAALAGDTVISVIPTESFQPVVAKCSGPRPWYAKIAGLFKKKSPDPSNSKADKKRGCNIFAKKKTQAASVQESGQKLVGPNSKWSCWEWLRRDRSKQKKKRRVCSLCMLLIIIVAVVIIILFALGTLGQGSKTVTQIQKELVVLPVYINSTVTVTVPQPTPTAVPKPFWQLLCEYSYSNEYNVVGLASNSDWCLSCLVSGRDILSTNILEFCVLRTLFIRSLSAYSSAQQAAQSAFYSQELNTYSWFSSPNYCTWQHVACSNSGFIETLYLDTAYFVGGVGEEIGNLTHITGLFVGNFNYNETFTNGELHSKVFYEMPSLQTVQITNTRLTIKLPQPLPQSSSLTFIFFAGLSGLVGQLPNGFFNKAPLQQVYIQTIANYPYQTLASLFGDQNGATPQSTYVQTLRTLYMDHVNIGGNIPPYFATNFPNLQELTMTNMPLILPYPAVYDSNSGLTFAFSSSI